MGPNFTALVLVLVLANDYVYGSPRHETGTCRFPLNLKDAPYINVPKSEAKLVNAEFLELGHGKRFVISCDSQFLGFSENEMEVSCSSASMINTPYGLKKFSDLICKQGQGEGRAGEVVVRTGACFNNYTEAQINFPSASPPYDNIATICHNEQSDETMYVKHYIYGLRLPGESGNRPSFKEGGFYPTISTDDCYKQVTQTDTVAILLGSRSLAEHYIQTGANLFFSRGHLAPNGDQISVDEKAATFYFINASPQWQTINGGNWNQLEIKTRDLAKSRGATFNVWTGSNDLLTLDDVNGNPVEIWLGRDSQGGLVRKLPVNKYTWKVIHDPSANQAVAVIMIQNPWIGTVTERDVYCTSICEQLSWVTWNIRDVRLGYTFCCTVASFKLAIPFAPDLPSNVSLLN